MKTDVLVLGAGPAGFAISYLMAKKGYSVEILDSAFFPRTKICGEFLNPQAVAWLQEQNLLDSLLKLAPFPIDGMRISDREGRSFTGHYASTNLHKGFAIMRKAFDTLLVTKAREAGIGIREGFKAESLVFEDGRAVGVRGLTSEKEPFEKQAAIVIGADGRNNLIGRTFRWMKNIRNLRKYVFLTYFENVPELSNFGEMHLVRDGYIGIAPLNSVLANVALVVDERACPGSDQDPKDFLFSRLQESPLAQRFHGLTPVAPLIHAGPLAFDMERTSGHGTLLVGDTCGFIDPFTGEGINYAFVSANLATGVLDRAFRSNDFSDNALAAYDAERKKALGKKFLLAKMLQKAVGRPRLAGFLVNRFRQNPALGDMMVSAVGSAIPVDEIWNMSFGWKLLTTDKHR